MTIKQIPFDVSLAIKAWKYPHIDSPMYWLFTKKGEVVRLDTYMIDDPQGFPFFGTIYQLEKAKPLESEIWTDEGKYETEGDSEYDLVLLEVQL